MVQRWTGMREGRHHATLLSAPYNLIARNAGFSELVRATDVIGPYQGNVAATRRSWAANNTGTIVSYVRAFRDSITWLYEPLNRVEAIEILCRHLPQMPQDIAAASYSELLNPAHGFFKTCELDQAGLKCVLDLRNRYAPSPTSLGAPDLYYDRQYSHR
jgi:ABC-type nitrate/sulfonate/bicarbonate transport system substrate-binding protein